MEKLYLSIHQLAIGTSLANRTTGYATTAPSGIVAGLQAKSNKASSLTATR